MSNSDTIREEVEELKGDIRRLRTDLAGLLSAVKDETGKRANAAKTRLSDGAANGIDRLKEALESAKDYTQKTYEKAHHKVEERPVTSILAALGVGLIIGRLFMGRR